MYRVVCKLYKNLTINDRASEIIFHASLLQEPLCQW